MRRTLIALLTLVTFAGYAQHIKINTERLLENWRILKSFGFNEAIKIFPASLFLQKQNKTGNY